MRLDKSQLSFRARPVSQTLLKAGRLSLVHYSDSSCRSKTSNVSSIEFGLPAIVSAPILRRPVIATCDGPPFGLFAQYFLNHFAQSQEVNLHPFLSISLPAFGFSPFSSSRLWLLAASIGDNVQTPWQVWHVVTCGDPPHSTLHILHFKNSELLTRTKFINAIVPKNRAGMEPYQ